MIDKEYRNFDLTHTGTRGDGLSNSALRTSLSSIFKSYFNQLTIPLKATSKIFVWICEGIARSFDLLYERVLWVLRLFFIQSWRDLGEWAKDRSIIQLKNESSELFYSRILNAYSFLKFSSTREGIERILKSVTTKRFELIEIYQDDFVLDDEKELLDETTILSDDESNFYFIVQFIDPLLVEEKFYIEQIIDLYKPAHVGYHIMAVVQDDFILDDENEELGINTYLEG